MKGKFMKRKIASIIVGLSLGAFALVAPVSVNNADAVVHIKAKIVGTVKVGSTLTAQVSGVPAGYKVSYQWKINGTDLGDASKIVCPNSSAKKVTCNVITVKDSNKTYPITKDLKKELGTLSGYKFTVKVTAKKTTVKVVKKTFVTYKSGKLKAGQQINIVGPKVDGKYYDQGWKEGTTKWYRDGKAIVVKKAYNKNNAAHTYVPTKYATGGFYTIKKADLGHKITAKTSFKKTTKKTTKKYVATSKAKKAPKGAKTTK
jgi:hypothetical protein